MVQLKEVRHSFAMLKLIVREVTKQMNLDDKEKEKFVSDTYTQGAMLEFLIKVFTNKQEQEWNKKERLAQNKKKDQLFLLCLDNAT